MLVKLTSKNRLTLPKALLASFPGASHFDVEVRSGRIVLSPMRLSQGDDARRKIEEAGITEQDVQDAIA